MCRPFLAANNDSLSPHLVQEEEEEEEEEG
jgi:hypothetical protein